MAGANLIGIKDIFGNKALGRVKTCKFHYKQIVNRRAKLLDAESAEEFKEKRNEDGYTAARKELHDFIEANPKEQECLVGILVERDERKFIFNVFTSAGPRMNQAEVIHASWANRDGKNLSLLDVAHMDTRDSTL
jgi:hypothetical protein